MEEVVGQECVQHDADSSLETVSKKTPKIIVKRVNARVTKIPLKRRKYEKSKKENFTIKKNLFENAVQTLMPEHSDVGSTNLLPILNILEKHNFKYEVKHEIKKTNSFYLQDNYMNTFYKYYPEYLCVDFLCEIPDLDVNLYLFISMDGNGCCEVVSIGLIDASDSGLPWLCDVFKKYNPIWHKIKFVICDKEEGIFEVIKMAFPEKQVLVSFFHSMKTLKRDLAIIDCETSPEDINKIIHVFEQMVFAVDESTYSENMKQLKQMPPSISSYFRKAWFSKRDTWVWGLQLNSKTFLKSFNAFLVSVRKKIRPLVNVQDAIENVAEKICSFLGTSRKEKFETFTLAFDTSSIYSQQALYQTYCKYVTHYAAELIYEQFNESSKVKNVHKLSCGKYICASENIVTTSVCSCNIFQLLSLPCCHIFAVRRRLFLPLFTEALSSNRWIKTNYLNMYLDLENIFVSNNKEAESIESKRYRKYFKLCSELWPLLIDCPESVSQERLQIVNDLFESLNNGINVCVKESEIQKDIPDQDTNTFDDLPFDCWKEIYGISLHDIFDSDNDHINFSLDPEISNNF
ncbi:zinc finger SWIM domain-containing protein 1-like isoform X1 [Argiope bruennichi]|uniref:zinc finger SWIM domain-containing protein 1-like isoform X1 n=1 Tax=Argiope bruennichi TaxID=94029 RepID=UPI0024946DE4|nr:zinc finger SWIM domain-containing protein 1-like isoform X1 [Argiope bruennichi]